MEYNAAIGAKYPACPDVRGAVDGLKIHIQGSTNWATQNYFFNGWKSAHYVNSVFVFAPDGRIRISVLNAPGTFHDSTIADYGVYSSMEQVYQETGAKVVVDSAFKLAQAEYLIRSSQKDPGDEQAVVVNRQATSIRQLSEHGMRTIQAQFPRLKDPLHYEEYGERRVILNLMVCLYNFNTSMVGVNEILNSFYEQEKYKYYGFDITDDANDIFQ